MTWRAVACCCAAEGVLDAAQIVPYGQAGAINSNMRVTLTRMADAKNLTYAVVNICTGRATLRHGLGVRSRRRTYDP